MSKRFSEQLAELERLEADAIPDPVDLWADAAGAIQAGEIALDGPAQARVARVGWSLDRNLEHLCACLNAALLDSELPFLALWPDQCDACLYGLRHGDLSVQAVGSPEYALRRQLRRPDGSVWNTQIGGADAPISRALVAWAAQMGEVLTTERAIAVLSGGKYGK